MDATHLHLYDWIIARELIESSGFCVRTATADGAVPWSRFLPKVIRARINKFALRVMPGLLAWQFVFVAELRAS